MLCLPYQALQQTLADSLLNWDSAASVRVAEKLVSDATWLEALKATVDDSMLDEPQS